MKDGTTVVCRDIDVFGRLRADATTRAGAGRPRARHGSAGAGLSRDQYRCHRLRPPVSRTDHQRADPQRVRRSHGCRHVPAARRMRQRRQPDARARRGPCARNHCPLVARCPAMARGPGATCRNVAPRDRCEPRRTGAGSLSASRAFRMATANSGAPYWVQIPIEASVVAFVALICIGTTILCGLAPALQTSKVGLTDILDEASRATAGSRRARRWADGFVVAQLALSLTMLAGAGLWMRNVYAFSQSGRGGEHRWTRGRAGQSLAAEVSERGESAVPSTADSANSSRRFQACAQESRARHRFGVLRASGCSIDSRESFDEASAVSVVTVGPGYLETLGRLTGPRPIVYDRRRSTRPGRRRDQ